ncbi:MAG: hypothetical protein ACOC0X_00750 [Halobacteriota archaeon]
MDLAKRGPIPAADLDDPERSIRTASGASVEHPLDPEGPIDNSITVLLGIVGGVIIGFVGTILLVLLTTSVWAFGAGLLLWLGSTAYLVRRRYAMDALSKAAYGVAGVLLAVPLVGLVLPGDFLDRGVAFVVFGAVMLVPAGVAAAVGWFAARYVPTDAGRGG